MAASPVGRRASCAAPAWPASASARPALLSACGTKAAKQTAESCVSKDLSASEKTLHFSNWPLYIDEKKVKQGGKKVDGLPLAGEVRDRQRRSRSTTSPTSTTTPSSSAVVRNQLADCQPTGRDIMC